MSTPIEGQEAERILGWHLVGLSIRDMRELMVEPGYPFVVRSKDGVRGFLLARGYQPHPSQRGPKVDGREKHCLVHDEPVVRRGPNNECPVCKVARARARRDEVRAELQARCAELEELGGRAAEIGRWIAQTVRVA